MIAESHPILSCEAARQLEAGIFAGDEAKEWAAMQRAGNAIGAAVLEDFQETGPLPETARVLVLAGKGHNAGDAFIAAQHILRRHPQARAQVVLAFGQRTLRPLAARAYREFTDDARGRITCSSEFEPAGFDVCLDGIFGFQFRPPVGPGAAELLERINALPIRLRAAVDLPSGGIFRADFTYAMGSVKTPALEGANTGRIHYLDLDFFLPLTPGEQRVLTTRVLDPLAALRPAHGDKRTYGHLFVVGGSRNFPGAVLMAVDAALHAGAGLVTAFVPESLFAAYAARAPEAMWVGCPVTPHGALALESTHLIRERIERATAFLIGPGIGREAETQALVMELVKTSGLPTVLDADALQPEMVRAVAARGVLTPHAGEFARIAGNASLQSFARQTGATVVLKGPVTRICCGGEPTVYHSFFGGPVLARGGSGDLLAGMIGGLLAQTPNAPLIAAARGAVWHGRAADLLARAHGQVAVTTTQLLDFLPAALRG